MPFPILYYYCQHADLKATWQSEGEEEGKEEYTRHSGFPHTAVSVVLTFNSPDSRVFMESSSTLYQGGAGWKNINHQY